MAQRRILLVSSSWLPKKFISEKAAFRLVQQCRAERHDVPIKLEIRSGQFEFNTFLYPIRKEDMRYADLIDPSYWIRLTGW